MKRSLSLKHNLCGANVNIFWIVLPQDNVLDPMDGIGWNGIAVGEILAYAMVAGVPAKIIGWMSAYGDVLEFDPDGYAEDSQGVKYQKVSRYSGQRLG